MVEIHESVQRCYANTLSGLSDVDREFTLCKDDGTSPTINDRTLLAQHIKVWDPVSEKFVPVFLCHLCCDDQCYHAYFPGSNDTIKEYVEAFPKCPGPQLYFYLLNKCRFLHDDVSKFIRLVFNLEQQALCSCAKYNKKTGMAYVNNTPAQMDIIDAACASDSGFATIQRVVRSPALKPMKYTGPNNTAMEYYDFADGQSITTIKTAAKNPSNMMMMNNRNFKVHLMGL